MTDPLLSIRRTLGNAIRSRIAGPNADERGYEIWRKPGERRFTGHDPIWRVHADSAMLIGGIRALLLQSLHPQAMAAVAAHSGYRSDPWGRLQRTSGFIATTTFGRIVDADRAVRKVRAVHRKVLGVTDDGTPYAASDPHLLLWVHIAEIDSFLLAYQRFGSARLSAAEADQYVEQTAHTARALGAENLPSDVAALRERLEAFRPELRSTRHARDVARFLVLNPPLPLWARPGYGALAAAAVGSLPGWALRMLRLPVVPVVTGPATRLVGAAATQIVQWAVRSVDDPGKWAHLREQR